MSMVNCPADEKSNKTLLVAKAIRRNYGKKEMDRASRRKNKALEEEPRRIGLSVWWKCPAALVSKLLKSQRAIYGKESDHERRRSYFSIGASAHGELVLVIRIFEWIRYNSKI